MTNDVENGDLTLELVRFLLRGTGNKKTRTSLIVRLVPYLTEDALEAVYDEFADRSDLPKQLVYAMEFGPPKPNASAAAPAA